MTDSILPIRTPPAIAYDCPDSQWENEERLSTSVSPGKWVINPMVTAAGLAAAALKSLVSGSNLSTIFEGSFVSNFLASKTSQIL